MKRNTKYRLMTGILTGSLLLSSLKPLKVSATNIEEPKHSISLGEFLDEIEIAQVKKFYRQLYEIYDFEVFNTRSEIPQYFQTIYSNKFSCGTIQSAGCGISSLAMVSSYLFDEIITPDMMVKYDSGPSPASAFEKGIRSLNLNCQIHRGANATLNLDEALDNNHPVIALYGPASIFTNSGHFVVIAGKTEDGKYIVNDPNLENLYKEQMVDGFINGFTREEIIKGLKGIYIFDNKQEFIDERDKILKEQNPRTNNYLAETTQVIGYTKKDSSLNVSYSNSQPIITNLEINSEVTRILSTSNGWDLVRYNNIFGYIKRDLIKYSNEISPIEGGLIHTRFEDIAVTNNKVEIKNSPNELGEKISTIEIDSEVEVLAIVENGWLMIRHNDSIGYIKQEEVTSLLEKVKELYPELNLVELSVKKIVYLTARQNIRCGNDIEFDSIGVLDKYETVRVLGEYGKYYLVLTNERNIGFVLKNYTKELSSSCITVDRGTGQIFYYENGEQIYLANTNNVTLSTVPKDGIYQALAKGGFTIIIDENINWRNYFYGNDTNGHTLKKIYDETQSGTQVIIHK